MMRFSHTRYFNCNIFILTQAHTNGIIISRIIRKEEGCMTDREILLSLYNDMHEVKGCMTSLENRVANLESSMTILKNDVSGLKNDVSGLKNDVSELKDDVSELKDDVSELKDDVSGLKKDVTGLKKDVIGLKKDVSGLKKDVSELKTDVSGLKNDVSGLKNDVTNIKMTLENETNRNIRIIAEGHSDLSRKFDEALKHEQQYHEERELLLVRVNSIENDVRRIKEKVAV